MSFLDELKAAGLAFDAPSNETEETTGLQTDTTSDTEESEVDEPVEIQNEVEDETEIEQDNPLDTDEPSENPPNQKATTEPHWSESYFENEEQVKEMESKFSSLQKYETLEQDEFIQGYIKHLEAGGKPETYIQNQSQALALNIETMSNDDKMWNAEVLKLQAEGYSLEDAKAEADDMLEELKDKYDEDIYERKTRRQVVEAEKELAIFKKKLAQPKEFAGQQVPTPEQIEEQKKQNQAFMNKFNKDVELKHSFKVGDATIEVKDKGNLFKSIKKEFEEGNVYASYTNKDGSIDQERYLKDKYIVENFQSIAKMIYEQGQTDYQQKDLTNLRNPKPKNGQAAPNAATDELSDFNKSSLDKLFG